MDTMLFERRHIVMDEGPSQINIIANSRVVIPKYIELSNFVSQEASSEKQYRLVFYSTVCHRGQYVQSGHYVSIVWDRQNDMYDLQDHELMVGGCISMI